MASLSPSSGHWVPGRLWPCLCEARERAELLTTLMERFLWTGAREGSPGRAVSGRQPPLFSEAFFPLGSILRVGGVLGKGTGKWGAKERDLPFESHCLRYSHHVLYLEGFQEAKDRRGAFL